MKNKINIIAAIKNPKLFGPLLGDLTTWSSWLVFLKAVFGLQMEDGELELYRKCTGRESKAHAGPLIGFKESYAIVGKARRQVADRFLRRCLHRRISRFQKVSRPR